MSPDNLLFFGSVMASVAAASALFSLYRHLAHRQPQSSMDNFARAEAAAGSDELMPLSAAAAGLPPFMYDRFVRHSGKGESWTESAVCLGVIQVGSMVKLLPACSHVYHSDCIDLWLSSRSTCPLCRCRVDPCGAGQEAGTQPAAASAL
jgi:hypothetical protein